MSNKRLGALLAAVFASILLAYSNHFENGFHFDDFHTITNNPAIRDLHNLPRFFTGADAFTSLPANRAWRPLLTTSLAFDYWLAGGLKPLYFQISTFFWYVLQLALMFFLFRNILARVETSPVSGYAAVFAVAWYGLHPAIAETVNYIIQRGDIFSTLAVIASLLIYISAPDLRRRWLYLIPVVLGTLAKPPAVAFAPILFCCVFLFETAGVKNRWRVAWSAAIPSFIVCGALLVLHSLMKSKTFVPGIISAHDYVITQPYVALRYFRTFFLPFWLSADTDLQAFSSILQRDAILGLLFLAALVWVIYTAARHMITKPIAFGLLWFVAALIPTSVFPLSEVENDHRMFMPFAGLVLSVTWAGVLAARKLLSSTMRRAALALAAAILAAYGYGVWQRNAVWHTEESLWRDVVEKSPHNGRGLMNYGLTLLAKGDAVQALDYFQRATAYTPNYSYLEINLGIANGVLGRTAEAERHFQRAVWLAPGDANSYYYYARWLNQQRRSAEAANLLKIAQTKDPANPDVKSLLPIVERTHAASADPVAAARANAERDPTPENYLNLSLAYHRAGRYNDCIAAARQALRLRPDYAEAYNNIAAAYESMSHWDEAIAAAQKAVDLKPDFQLARNNLIFSQNQKKLAH